MGDEPLVGEKVHPILYGHRQDLGDVLVPIGNVERVLIVARALAGGTGHLHVGHQVQLGGDRALATALLAAASLDIEAKARGRIAALLGLGRRGEEAADVVVETDVRGRVGAGRAADGGLVDVDHIAYVLDPVEAVVRTRQHAAVVEDGVELLVENVVDERALARARGSTDADEDPQGDFDIEVVEVVGAGTADMQVAAVERAALNRHVNALAAGEKLAGQGVWILQYLANGTLGGDAAAVHARAGADLDDVIGRPNGLLVVFHHNDRVAHIAQAAQRLNHLDVVFGMEANGRLVEHVEHAH